MAELAPAIRAAAAVDLAAVIDALAIPQAAYLASNGRYWRSAPTHPIRPADGDREPPDPNAAIGHLPSWDRMGVVLPALMTARAICNEYNTRAGPGYTVCLEVIQAGDLFACQSNVIGPGDWLTSDWVDIAEVEEMYGNN